jgi:hypothetical protein
MLLPHERHQTLLTEQSGQINVRPQSGHLFSFGTITPMSPALPYIEKMSPAVDLKSADGRPTIGEKPPLVGV